MTLDELRDWHARRAGWTHEGGCKWFNANRSGIDATFYNHPFPATLDGADAAMPNGWDWSREYRGGSIVWFASNMAEYPHTKRCHVVGTTDKIRDLYELSKLAWEQEAA